MFFVDLIFILEPKHVSNIFEEITGANAEKSQDVSMEPDMSEDLLGSLPEVMFLTLLKIDFPSFRKYRRPPKGKQVLFPIIYIDAYFVRAFCQKEK